MAMLDTLRASQQLQDAGIEAGHADALVTTFSEGFAERLASRDELHQAEARLLAEVGGVRTELHQTEARLLAEIGDVRTELKHEIEGVRTELKLEIASVRADLKQAEERSQGQMHQLENRLMRWTIGAMLAGMGIAAAIAAAIVQVVG
jgi:vacuolar-type H+-ATPase subunit I/STV1